MYQDRLRREGGDVGISPRMLWPLTTMTSEKEDKEEEEEEEEEEEDQNAVAALHRGCLCLGVLDWAIHIDHQARKQ